MNQLRKKSTATNFDTFLRIANLLMALTKLEKQLSLLLQSFTAVGALLLLLAALFSRSRCVYTHTHTHTHTLSLSLSRMPFLTHASTNTHSLSYTHILSAIPPYIPQGTQNCACPFYLSKLSYKMITI
jgi:hypothetical protein